MKTNRLLAGLLGLVVTLFIAGCVTQRIDWNGRVGAYTYDQAVKDFGPPDKQARLTDGQIVAEWITRYSNGSTTIVSPGFYGYPGGGGIIQTTPDYYESKLRLIFTTNYVLTAWSKH